MVRPLHYQLAGLEQLRRDITAELALVHRQPGLQMFGLCSCQRCLEDVKALTLNHLAPKYVVLEPNDRVPRLTVYES